MLQFSRSFQSAKELGLQVANPQIATFAEGPLILKFCNSAFLRISGLRNLLPDHPPLPNTRIHVNTVEHCLAETLPSTF